MFIDDIKDFITDELYNFEGQKFYGADMYHELTLEENNDGCWKACTDEADRYIVANAHEALDTIRYFADEFGTMLDVRDYCKLTFFMLYWGVNMVLAQVPFVDEHWNDEFVLDEQAIKTIIEQMGEVKEL